MVNRSDRDATNQRVIAEFRAAGGVVGGPLAGRMLLLLSTRGAKSGLRRTTPLRYFSDGGTPVVFASNLGAARHPAWYHNLVAEPAVEVEVGVERFGARAVVVEGEARARLWERVVAEYPFLAEHQARTSRQIPLVALERTDG